MGKSLLIAIVDRKECDGAGRNGTRLGVPGGSVVGICQHPCGFVSPVHSGRGVVRAHPFLPMFDPGNEIVGASAKSHPGRVAPSHRVWQ